MAVTTPARVFSPAAMRSARLSAGRTIREVCEATGIRKQDTIRDYELGRVSPQADDLAAIARALGADVIEFFPLEGEE
jgi:transcriptional regulator with XRE-family HTH domain